MRLKLVCLSVIAIVALAAPLAASSAAGGSKQARSSVTTKTVTIRDNSFNPSAVSVPRGGKVVWRWKGANDHNVRFRQVPKGAKRPRGATTKSTGRFARTLKKAGTYRYVCTIHQALGMKGRVVVK